MKVAIKVVLVGNAQSGKTKAVHSLIWKEQPEGYIPTSGVEIYRYYTPDNNHYNIWDCPGDPVHSDVDNFYKVDIAVIFHGGWGDKTPQQWEDEVRGKSPDVIVYHISTNSPLSTIFD